MQNDLLNKLRAFTVLYVEDEDGIRSNIEEILKHFFKELISTKSAVEAYSKYSKNRPDLIITDIKLGKENGLDLIKKIRQTDSKTRIIITSAYTDLEYLLQATELNLIKYIVKPLNEDKLLQALEAFLNSFNDTKVYTLIPNWTFNYSKAIITNETEEFTLTKKENNFLKLLINKNRIISYEEIENAIWEEDTTITANAIRLFIKNLRKKLPKNIQGVGYKLVLD